MGLLFVPLCSLWNTLSVLCDHYRYDTEVDDLLYLAEILRDHP